MKIKKGKSQATYERAKQLIPGGTQLLSKRPEMFLPGLWPAYYSKAKGCEVWDLDGNKYVDMAYMGVGASLLGYANKTVDNAVIDSIKKGINTTLNAAEEIELAEMLIDIHPWSDMVRYTKTGGEAMSVAVRIARAATGNDKILFCGYHGWHDWYISTNLTDDNSLQGHLLSGLSPSGVPAVLKGTSMPFTYNDTNSFLNLVEEHSGEIGCVVMETIRNFEPDPEFLKTIRKVTADKQIVLIVDEITAGFRMNIGGAHLSYGFEPDIATFGKAFSNGYPMGAIIGKKKYMEAAQESFISSLFWTERSGIAATIATINEMRVQNTPERIIKIGNSVRAGWQEISKQTGVSITITGFPAIISMGFQNNNALYYKTFLTQEMLKRGYLATTSFYASTAHEEYIEDYLDTLKEVFVKIANALAKNNIKDLLEGEVCHSGFKRLT